ncbi:MAG: divalent-cation tolerance protein CutA [Alphaproteobacteria bacterium]
MKSTRTHVIVTTTTNTAACTDAIIAALLNNRLVACIQVSAITSHYSWKGKIAHDTEQLLTIKTRKALLNKVEACIRAHHTYETPQIVSWHISHGHAPYFKWIDEVTK